MDDILIKDGRVIDPSNNIDNIGDVLISDGKIKAVEKNINEGSFKVIDAAGKIVMPGLIDMHTHLREPGAEEAETIISGCEAAAAGGFTAVCAMPNTDPATDDSGRVKFILERAKGARAKVYPVGAITRGRAGNEITEMNDMALAGAVAFSDDGVSVANSSVMLNALKYSFMIGKPLIAHEEDPGLDRDGQMNEGILSAELGLKGMPSIAEEIMVSRDIELAKYTGTAIHITHISTRGTVDIIRKAKASGVKVTCDVTPHHLALSEELVATFDTRYKMNPPLRTMDDIEAILEGLSDGTIDAIATDHAPHYPEYKEIEFLYSAFGVTGLETALGVVQRVLVEKNIISFSEVIEKMSFNPAKILGIEGGTLTPGSPADITLYEPASSWKVDPSSMKSKSKNTAFFDWELPGKVYATFVDGIMHLNES